ncbi:hypothetical protein BDV59DRAFT_206530 [Aspergillus ambiguus]|uniref:uncharacterized protein n=1 Tax=Aspergillus ambiguus TaxID=176160 RepID=UPI003CCE24F4
MSTTPTTPGDPGAGQQKAPTPPLNRSCESCRSLKVRCLPDSISPNQCQRCAKAKRACVFVAPQKRRPRKRTDSRVAQLEREMRQMRSLLKGRLQVDESDSESSDSDMETSLESDPKTDQKETLSPILETQSSKSWSTRHADAHSPEFPLQPPRETSFPLTSFTPTFTQSLSETPPGPDVIELGVISMECAEKLVVFFVTELMVFAPVVWLPPDTTASLLRRSKPVLFLSVLAAAALSVDGTLAAILNQELVRLYAERFFVCGDKSLELVQALLLMIIFYYPPDSPLKLQYYQYTHIAATMALEIGLASGGNETTELNSKANSRGVFDEHFAQQARAVLGCYHLASTVAMKTRRPNLLSWNEWMNKCTIHLESSPHAEDRQIAVWFQLQRIVDQAITSFGLDDTSVTSPLSDMRVHAILRWFDDRMQSWKKNLSLEMSNVTTAFEYHYTNLAIYELAVGEGYRRPESIKEQYYTLPRPDSEGQRDNTPLSAARIDITIKWMNAAQEMLDFFLTCDTDLLRKIPNIIYARVAAAMMSLLKIHFSVSAGTMGEVVTPQAVKVASYLDALNHKLTEASGDKKYRIPSRWLYVIGVKGRSWYERLQERKSVGDKHGLQVATGTPIKPPDTLNNPTGFGSGDPSPVGMDPDVSQIPNFHPMPGTYGPGPSVGPIWAPSQASPGGQNYFAVQQLATYPPPMLGPYAYGGPQQQMSPGDSGHHRPVPPTTGGEVNNWVPEGSVYVVPNLPGF